MNVNDQLMFENGINVLELNLKALHMHQNNCKSYKYEELTMVIHLYVQIIEKEELNNRINESRPINFHYVRKKVNENNTNMVDLVNENRNE